MSHFQTSTTNNSTSELKGNELAKKSEREFRSLKMIRDLKED
jgi:hypothetical protein